jgi:hypothetical protein
MEDAGSMKLHRTFALTADLLSLGTIEGIPILDVLAFWQILVERAASRPEESR